MPGLNKTGDIPRDGDTKQVTVGISVTRFTASSIPIKSVTIKADDDNSGNIYIGFSDSVSSSTGFRLKAGQGIDITIDDLNKIYLIADAASQKAYAIYVW